MKKNFFTVILIHALISTYSNCSDKNYKDDCTYSNFSYDDCLTRRKNMHNYCSLQDAHHRLMHPQTISRPIKPSEQLTFTPISTVRKQYQEESSASSSTN